jgi:hypothetical protein
MTAIIKVTYTSLDGAKEVKRFGTITGASEYAKKWVGDHPTIGSQYAISDDGIGKIEVTGSTLEELFPEKSA